MNENVIKELIKAAINARTKSYSPYSNYAVGAALRTRSGKIFEGCNIENAAFGPSICAERVAMFKAVSEGNKDFEAIAVVGGPHGKELNMAYPCGVCRQVMMEFADPESFKIIVATSEESYEIYSLTDLLPHGFGASELA